jgi:hypothetical protein
VSRSSYDPTSGIRAQDLRLSDILSESDFRTDFRSEGLSDTRTFRQIVFLKIFRTFGVPNFRTLYFRKYCYFRIVYFRKPELSEDLIGCFSKTVLFKFV